ncbi:MAG TPA: plasmid partitioning protein RepB C-terminal domain-containing protein [Polyangiaceae bacterium]|nr:plasmid partitioning protein RepB C-terminal domain-containing protein [Polyangiaceae bacterium]
MKTVQMIPVSKIHVANPRARNKAKFSEIVANVSTIGLKRPITVRPRPGSEGEYDLVCGQGRLEAFISLRQTEIPAFIREVNAEDGYVMSLVENIARRTPRTLELVGKIVALEKRGYTPAEIAGKIGVSEGYARSLLKLFEQGEERLLAAVERGEIPIAVAAEIAVADDKDIQRSLAEAYESGRLRGKALIKARDLVEARRSQGKRQGTHPSSSSKPRKRVSADEIVRTYRRETQRQRLLVKKARLCETRLLFLATSLRELLQNEDFVNLLRAEALDKMPEYLATQVKAQAAS